MRKDPKTGVKGIYCIRNLVNGKRYVGSSISLAYRWREHKYHLKRGTHPNQHLQRAFDKYKAENFKFMVLEIIEDIEVLIDREQWWIDSLSPEYNLSKIAGKNARLGVSLSEETKRKIGDANKRQWTDEKIEEFRQRQVGNKYNLGKSLSEETRKKISESHKTNKNNIGRKQSDDEKRKRVETRRRNGNMGHTLSELQKENIAKVQRRIPLIISSPNGIIYYDVFNLSGFCRDHNISFRGMRRVVSGISKSGNCKGWRVLNA